MENIRAYVANFLGNGEEQTQYHDKWVRDTLIFNCEGFSFQFIQCNELINKNNNDLKGQFLKTTEVIINNVDELKVKKALKVLDRICWLLSFASLSRVICYGYEYPDGSGLGSFYSVTGEANYFRPTIDICDGLQTTNYINQCYKNYRKLEKKRKLNVIIDYLIEAERVRQPTEIKLIISFIILENLKGTYAKSMKIPYKKGGFKKIPKPSRGKDTYSFGELLHDMLKQVGMRSGLKRVISLRNVIIHSGMTEKPYTWQLKKYELLHDLLREYILRLLGYKGSYLTYSSCGVVKQL